MSSDVIARQERRGMSGSNGQQSKWLMGIVAATLGGILIGWYNDVRELRPDVAVLKAQMQDLNQQVRITNQRLETLTAAIVQNNERELARAKP